MACDADGYLARELNSGPLQTEFPWICASRLFESLVGVDEKTAGFSPMW